MFTDITIDDFQQQIIDQGHEVEAWARRCFPGGVLVESKREQAVIDTQAFLEAGEKIIFQATFQTNGGYAMIDVLHWEDNLGGWVISEVKGTTSKDVKKSEHVDDAAFQRWVMQQAGYEVKQVNLLELDKEFRKDGDINPQLLIKFTDITAEIDARQSDLEIQIQSAKDLLAKTEEPRVCECVYKSRSNQCPCFSYCHPEVPDYSVHDICRIGLSKKKLREMVDNDWLEITDIPLEFKLSPNQTNHVHTTITGDPIIRSGKIQQALETIEYPIYFLDYETWPTAVPAFEGCYPFQQVPFQYSLHVLREPGGELEHTEFLHTENSSPMPHLVKQLRAEIGDTGSVIVWNKKFEGKCHEDLAEAFPEMAEFLHGLNNRFFDLMEIFSKQYYVHPDFRGSSSIKYALPVICPELSYADLNVQNGGAACKTWKQMIFDTEDTTKAAQMADDLRAYCKLDTLAMVRIWEALLQI